jgi:hypothetical protein
VKSLIVWATALPSIVKTMLGIVVLALIGGALIWLYGRGKEHQGQREAVVAVSETRAAAMLDTAKHDYTRAATQVATIKAQRRATPVTVQVVRPGVVEIRDSLHLVPIEVTQQLDTNRIQLERDTLVMDAGLAGWKHALDAADSTNAVKNVYKADAGNHHLVLKVAGVTVGIVGIALLVHHLAH